MSRRIGFLGGTFDPIHQGHLAMAQFVQQALALDELELIPNHVPPHKSGPDVSARDRLKMVELAAGSLSGISVNPLELEQDDPSYSVYTLEKLRATHPEQALFFIMGMDSFVNLSSWHQWDQLLTHVNLVVCQRPGDSVPAQGPEAELLAKCQTQANTQSLSGQIVILENPDWPISSTQIRAALAQGNAMDKWLTPEVSSYIKHNNLYR